MERVALSSAPLPPNGVVQAALSPELWQVLLDQSDQALASSSSNSTAAATRLAVCLSSRTTSRTAGQLSSILCWACRSDPKDNKQSASIAVIQTLRTLYPELLGSPKSYVNVKPVKPVVLSNIFLCALDEASYEWAQDPDNLDRLLVEYEGRIVRQGELWTPSGKDTNQAGPGFRIAMTEPVLQGVIREGHTEIIVSPPVGPSTSRLPPTRQAPKSRIKYDVNEDFLAASILGGLDGDTPRKAVLNGFSHSPISSPSVHSEANGSSIAHELVTGLRGTSVAAIPLTQRLDASGMLQPKPDASEDEQIQAFVRMSDLGRLGVFSGSLVLVENTVSSAKRLVRLYACDQAFSQQSDISEVKIALSPMLLHNLGNPSFVSFQPLPPPQQASFPTAEAITIARVASELSMHKRYQPIFLAALKAYFQEKKRILVQGDLIAIPFDDSLARFTESASEQEPEPEESEDEPVELPQSRANSASIAYFKVTHIQGPSSANTSSSSSLGCCIDPSSTSMVQTGLENSPIPSLSIYVDTAAGPPSPTSLVNELGSPTLYARLLDYVSAANRPRSSSLSLNLTVLIKGARGSGKATTARWAAQQAGFHLFELDCYELLGETDVKTEGNLSARFERAAACTPCILLLRHIEALARKSQAVETGQEPTISATLQDCLKSAQKAWSNSGHPLVVVGTATDADKIPVSVLGCFKEDLVIDAPSEAERLVILQAIFRADSMSPDVSLKAIAVQTAALVARDLVDLASRVRILATEKLTELSFDLDDCRAAGIALTAADFGKALDQARSSYSESIGAPKIPNVTWDDVGGLANVKTEILDTIQLPLEHPELFADGLKKRSGVLLYGPPGTGKTLLAKAVATSCSLNFFSVKGPELLNMYIGESEANVRRVFQRARDAKPCVIFFDELDSVAPKRGNQGDSGGVMDRIVSQLLAELDGMSEGQGGADVFVIGATNRPDLLDPALLRPGRFDRMLYLGVSDNHDAQLKIIEALTRKFKLDPNIDLHAVADLCPFNYTGADFYALCSDAMLKAMSRKAEEVDRRIAILNEQPEHQRMQLTPQYYLAELATPEEIEVLVGQRDFELALSELVPSVSQAEMDHYRIVQQKFNPSNVGTGTNATSVLSAKTKGKGKASSQ